MGRTSARNSAFLVSSGEKRSVSGIFGGTSFSGPCGRYRGSTFWELGSGSISGVYGRFRGFVISGICGRLRGSAFPRFDLGGFAVVFRENARVVFGNLALFPRAVPRNASRIPEKSPTFPPVTKRSVFGNSWNLWDKFPPKSPCSSPGTLNFSCYY